ncbi:MAG TPA: glutamine amidotransferase [Planctomycetaceae bacterium]|nr:glutamine amidotransferase [Planctomycetaceae bacterium]
MQLTVEPIWGWSGVAIVAAGLLALIIFTDRVQLRRLAPWQRRWLLGLKTVASLLLVMAMLRPAVVATETSENSVQLLVAVDVSRSMTTPDGPGGITRWQAVRDDLERASSLWKKFAEKAEIRQFEFDRELRPRQEDRQDPDGPMTAIGQALDDLVREARQQPTAAILFLTDGAQRALSPHDLDPLLAARKLAEANAPVYPVGYGATSLTTTTLDLAVQDLLADPVVFEKKLVPLKVQLRGTGAVGKKVMLRVLVEDRTGQAPGTSGELKPAPVSVTAKPMVETEIQRDDELQSIDLSFMPATSGEIKIAVEVVPLEGELIRSNNRQETIITVRQGGLRIAYFDVLRSEQTALRMVNGADKIQLDYFQILGGKFKNRTVIPATAFDPKEFDVYLIGDVPAEVFGEKHLTNLAQRVREGAGLMMLGGLENFSSGGYGATPLADLLPVALAPTGAVIGMPDVKAQYVGPQPMVPTELGLKRFVMQLAPGERNRARWDQLAPLMGATKLAPKNDLVEIWATTKDGQPLLMATEVGRARVAAFAGDTTYQWVQHGQGEEHQRFWRQMILWLARKEADSDQPAWVRVDPRNFLPGATVPLEFGARSTSGEPMTDAVFQVQVTRPDGKTVPVAPRSKDGQFSADFTQTDLAGDYWVRVTARKDAASLGLDALTRFIVDPKDLELDQPNADYDLLRKIAELTGGQLLRSEDLEKFLKDLQDRKVDELTRVRVYPLWDNWWMLLAFVVVVSAEWTIRKRSGLA